MFLSAAKRLRAGGGGVQLTLARSCLAWAHPEHRDNAGFGVRALDPQRAATFDKLWKEVHHAQDCRLCELPTAADHGSAPVRPVWAALPAIAGDYACFSKHILGVGLRSACILAADELAEQLMEEMSRVRVVSAPIVIGRELGVTCFGLGSIDSLLASSAKGQGISVVDCKPTHDDMPNLEHRPFQSFASNQKSSVVLRLAGGIELPYGCATVPAVGAPQVRLRPVSPIGLRMAFDRRYYQ